MTQIIVLKQDTQSADDVITIRIQASNSGTTPAIVSSNTRNWFEVGRLGM